MSNYLTVRDLDQAILGFILEHTYGKPSVIKVEGNVKGKVQKNPKVIIDSFLKIGFVLLEKNGLYKGDESISISSFLMRRDNLFIYSGNLSLTGGGSIFSSEEESPVYFISDCIEIVENSAKKYFDLIIEDDHKKVSPTINILVNNSYEGMYLSKRTISASDVDLDVHYSKGFREVSDKILHKLRNDHGGLMLFSGEPGTGKTNYIRKLTEWVPDREFIFIPPFMIDNLVSPQLLSLLLEHPKCILVIEDAEKAITKRENSINSSLVSTILNLSDGFMSDVIQSSLILTFNCDEKDIDEALLRKGRLKVHHRFNKLSADESNKVFDLIGKDYRAVDSMSLAEIYNLAEDTGYSDKKEEKRIGFGA